MITDDRLKWPSSPDYAQSEPGQIAAELVTARARISKLKAELAFQKELLSKYHAANCQSETPLADDLQERICALEAYLRKRGHSTTCVSRVRGNFRCDCGLDAALERGTEPSGMEMAQREADEAAGDNDPRDRVRASSFSAWATDPRTVALMKRCEHFEAKIGAKP